MLRDDQLRPYGMRAKELALRTGFPVARVQRITKGAPIDSRSAIGFATVPPPPTLYWIVLQLQFDMEFD